MPSWEIHVLTGTGGIQRQQLTRQSRGMGRVNTHRGAGLKEPMQAFVPETLDHATIVSCNVTL